MSRLRRIRKLREAAEEQPTIDEEMPSFSLGLTDSEDEAVVNARTVLPPQQRRAGRCIIESDHEDIIESDHEEEDAEGMHRSKRQRTVLLDMENWLQSEHAARAERRNSVKAAAQKAKHREAAKRKRQPRVEEYLAAKRAKRQSKQLVDQAARLRRQEQKKMFRSFPHEQDHIEDATVDNYKAGRRAYQVRLHRL